MGKALYAIAEKIRYEKIGSNKFYYDKSKYLPFINPDGINWIKDTVEYKKFNKEKTQSKISKILNV